MALRVAVLDLGTNTFNLVVAEQNSLESFHILHSSKLPVKLGEGGINHGKITLSGLTCCLCCMPEC